MWGQRERESAHRQCQRDTPPVHATRPTRHPVDTIHTRADLPEGPGAGLDARFTVGMATAQVKGSALAAIVALHAHCAREHVCCVVHLWSQLEEGL